MYAIPPWTGVDSAWRELGKSKRILAEARFIGSLLAFYII